MNIPEASSEVQLLKIRLHPYAIRTEGSAKIRQYHLAFGFGPSDGVCLGSFVYLGLSTARRSQQEHTRNQTQQRHKAIQFHIILYNQLLFQFKNEFKQLNQSIKTQPTAFVKRPKRRIFCSGAL